MRSRIFYLIPDTQIRPGVRNPLTLIARHISDLRPDEVIHLGDHHDFPSLSAYDKGKKSHRVHSYLKDVRAGNEAFTEFFDELRTHWPRYRRSMRLRFLEGNHEHRRIRAIEYGDDALVDLIHEHPPDYSGWDQVVPFLKEIQVQGITFCHYFQQPNSHRAISSANAILNKKHTSCIAGHKQGFDYSEQLAAFGKKIQALVIGSCYFHDEEYKAHNNHHWRGVVVLKTLGGGEFDFERFSLSRLDSIY